MPSPRAERDALLAAVDRDIDALSRPIARAVTASVRRYAVATPEGARTTPASRARVLADVDAALAPVHGAFPGDPRAALTALVLKRAQQGAALPAAATTADIRHRLRDAPDVLAAAERPPPVPSGRGER